MRLVLAIALLGLIAPAQEWESYPRTPASAASEFVGKTRAVCGAISGVQLAGPQDKAVFELDVAPATTPFVVEVSRDIRRSFGESLERVATRLQACVLGKIEQTPTGLRITVNDKDRIRLTAGATARVGAPADPFAPGVPKMPQSGVTWPQVRRQVKAKYTSDAMRYKLTGVVELDAVVLTDGTVGAVQVMRSLDEVFGLDDAAIRALKEWKFSPATRGGQPLEVVITVVIEFLLH